MLWKQLVKKTKHRIEMTGLSSFKFVERSVPFRQDCRYINTVPPTTQSQKLSCISIHAQRGYLPLTTVLDLKVIVPTDGLPLSKFIASKYRTSLNALFDGAVICMLVRKQFTTGMELTELSSTH